MLLLALGAEYEQDTSTGWMKPWARYALTGGRKASQETCVNRYKASVVVKHSRSRIPIQYHNKWESIIECGCVEDRAFGV